MKAAGCLLSTIEGLHTGITETPFFRYERAICKLSMS
jgi:hypothetical protein